MTAKETKTTDTVAKKTAAKKPAAKKPAAKKPAAKKVTAKKPAAKKPAAKKPAAKTAVATKKTAVKKPAAKKVTVKKPAEKKAAAKKPAVPAKKTVAKDTPAATPSTETVKKNDRSTQVSEAFLQQMQGELEELKSVTRLQVAERLKEAIALGDLSENSEYEDAKNQQAFIEGRIAELEEKIRTAKIVEAPKGKNIGLGSLVTLEDQETKEAITYLIVGSAEADLFAEPAKISDESPVGKALMHHKKGDTVIVQAPEQELHYTIADIQNKPVKRTKK